MDKRTNFTQIEIEILLEIIKNYSSIIECKKTNAFSNDKKKQAWDTICMEFNSIPGVIKRTAQQLKDKYKNLKKLNNTLQRKTADKSELFKTGGGYSQLIFNRLDEILCAVSTSALQESVSPTEISEKGNEDVIKTAETILPDIPESSSMAETSLDISHQEASPAPSGANIKQKPEQGSYSTHDHSSPGITYSNSLTPCAIPDSNFGTNHDHSCQQSSPASVTHLPSCQLHCGLTIKPEPNQNSSASRENSLPSRNHSFSLIPNGTPDSTVCSMSTDERSSFEMRINLLGKNWIEKMKVLRTDQRIYAEKLINDVLFEAELGRLKY